MILLTRRLSSGTSRNWTSRDWTTVGLFCEGDKCLNAINCREHEPCKNVTIYNETVRVDVPTYQVGHLTLYLKADDNSSDVSNAFAEVSIGRSEGVVLFSIVVGWIYFAAWSISFYPQILTNWRRKSVTGLNFDFIFLNFLGFTFYSIFNVCLYYIPSFQEEYNLKHPRSSIPVELNDVGFSLHAIAVTFITIIQCYVFENGGQKVALWAKGFITVSLTAAFILLGLVLGHLVSKLDYIYFFSYVKLTITIIKYIPQVST